MKPPEKYYPIAWGDGWTVAYTDEEGATHPCSYSFFVSLCGPEGRAMAQERADWNNKIVAARDE